MASEKKVLLIRPENIYSYNNYPPLNLISIGTSLKKAGFEVDIVNCAREREPLNLITQKAKDAAFIGITMVTSECCGAYNVISRVKSHLKTPVVVGGWHCTLFPEQMMENNLIDYVVVGEGEEAIFDIYSQIGDDGNSHNKLYGGRKINLDNLPLPEYDLDYRIEEFMTSYLTDRFVAFEPKPPRWLPYESSRGCPSRCTFCINTVTKNNVYRKKSAAKVIDELGYIVKKYNINHVKFIDDNFFVDINRSREIAEGIMAMKLSITWDAECRCDYFNGRMLNDDTLELFKRSGLVQLTLGIESGSQKTLDILKKDIDVEQSKYTVMKCDEHKIIARSSFMIEVPGETIYDIRETIKLINYLRKYKYFSCGVTAFRPYPKCELTQGLLQKGFLVEPKSFEEWGIKQNMELYTSCEHNKPWQVHPSYSESAAYFLNIESEVRLGQHQIKSRFLKLINAIFVRMAKTRNRLGLYQLSLDKYLYKIFLTSFYKLQQKSEKLKK